MKKKNVSVLMAATAAFLAGCAGLQPNNPHDVITVGTYNVRCPADKTPPFDWQTRVPLIREVIRRTGAEIIGLQEPVDYQLQAILKNTGFKSVGGARDDFRKSGEYSCIIYNTKRFDALDSGTFGLSETPDVPGVRSWGSRCPRIASWGLFRDRKTGKKFIMCNTHLDHKSELARINGIKLIVERFRLYRDQGMPLILTGDFNAQPGTETIKTACSLLRDSAAVSETGHQGDPCSFHKWGTRSPRVNIDYIFVSDGIRVLKHRTEDNRVNGVYSSDHDPVFAEIVLP